MVDDYKDVVNEITTANIDVSEILTRLDIEAQLTRKEQDHGG